MTYNANFPVSADVLANPTTLTNRDDPGFELHGVISRIQDILEALEAKVGIGSSTPPSTAAVLRRTATGASAWAQLAAGDIAPGAIVNADINAAAGIAVTKAAPGANGTLLQTSSGAANWSANPTVTGAITAGTKLYPSGQSGSGFDIPVAGTSVAAGATSSIGTNARMGIVIVTDPASGQSGIFQLQGIGNAVALLAGSATYFDVVAAANSKVNVIYFSSGYYVHNGYGAARAIWAMYFGIGT